MLVVATVLRRLGQVPCLDDLPLTSVSDRMAAYSDPPELFAGKRLLHADRHDTHVLVVGGSAPDTRKGPHSAGPFAVVGQGLFTGGRGPTS